MDPEADCSPTRGARTLEERFPIASTRERWTELLPLTHALLPLPEGFSREGDELVVRRRMPPGRPIREGRIPRELAPQLLLQAASALAFFRAHGFGLDESDLSDARWDRVPSGARLWLSRTPGSLSGARESPAPAPVLGSFLDRLARRGGRIADRDSRLLARSLSEPEARSRRPESIVASVFRSFPDLACGGAAVARRRTAGRSGSFFREPLARARIASGLAALEGKGARIFRSTGSTLRSGSALPLDPPPSSATQGARRLRRLAESDGAGGRFVWIAAASEAWDELSRRAFEAVSRFLPESIEIRRIPARVAPPALPDEWRREIFVPCGHIVASLRFYEWLAREAASNPEAGEAFALASLESDRWASFASDVTGQAPLPDVAASGRTGSSVPAPTRESALRSAARERDPARQVELLLGAGLEREALEVAGRWLRHEPGRAPEAWFELAARFAGSSLEKPPWLELLEAERQAAGGEPRTARDGFERVAGSGSASPEQRRQAALRAAEVSESLEGASEAARRAAAWRRAFPKAAAGERMRALRLEAVGLAREGSHAEALVRLGEADGLVEDGDEAARIENALARAALLSLEGKFADEAAIYDRWRSAALRLGDDALLARFVSREALGLSDRRRYPEAAARLEEALSVLRDDAGERARVSIDLAATLYHAGRPERCEALLEDAARLAASGGRRDLLRIARSNAVELALSRARWDEASASIRELLREAEDAGDALWKMIGLHHRSRLALRRGDLERAAEDNAIARELSERLGDRLEVGELWLEEGDRLLYAGDIEGASRAWQRAAEDPPDRCDTDRQAMRRLEELEWRSSAGPPAARRAELLESVARGDYAAAETAARWRVLFGEEVLGPDLSHAARRLLRERGGLALADHVFRDDAGLRTSPVSAIPIALLRELREALACALAGQDGHERLSALGLPGLSLEDAGGAPVLRLGPPIDAAEPARELDAGAARYRLRLPRGAPEPLASAAALLAETLLFRSPAAGDSSGFAEGWRRLGIITADASMEEPFRRLVRFAAQGVTVLVHGESGSGKEAVARAVHQLSPRAHAPFVAVNVPAIPAALLESELFGHVRGAFTGAERDRAGLLEEASRGTIFLDEIGDLAPGLQAKLLRTLQDRELRRLGENRSRRIDVRVVSATSRDLAREVEAGRFREDLFYRLHVAVIDLPPLRRRGRDVLVLGRHFLEGFARDYGRGALRLAPEAASALLAHPWPGNVRELQNAMAQAAALADRDGLIGMPHLPEALRRALPRAGASESYRARLDAHRRQMISEALEQAGGNRTLAARRLGLSRQALRYLVRELGIEARDAGPPGAVGRPPDAGAPGRLDFGRGERGRDAP